MVRFRSNGDSLFQHHVVRVLEKADVLKPSSQRHATWQIAECDLVINICMRFYEIQSIKPVKPLNPAQARIAGLKRQKDNIAKQLKAERNRQKIAKAQQELFKL